MAMFYTTALYAILQSFEARPGWGPALDSNRTGKYEGTSASDKYNPGDDLYKDDTRDFNGVQHKQADMNGMENTGFDDAIPAKY